MTLAAKTPTALFGRMGSAAEELGLPRSRDTGAVALVLDTENTAFSNAGTP
jgi:hypothetical protein